MADAKAAAPEAGAVPAPAAPKSRSGLVVILAAVLASTAVSGGVAWFLSQRAPAAAAAAAAPAPPARKAPAQYLALEPSFVVNLDDAAGSRYLMIEVQVMGRDAAELEAVKTHAPRIRNALLLLFAQQKLAALSNTAGKEALRAQVLAEIRKALQDETGKPVVEAVYFTSFVMQ